MRRQPSPGCNSGQYAPQPGFLATLTAFAAVVFAVYGATLYPTVPGGDSGELIVAAYQLGVAHPPGYPLFTLLAKLSTLLPLGTVAWRVGLLSAAFGALAASVLAGATWKLTRNLAAGFVAGGLFAFSPLVWRYAGQAEVFSLNNLFVALLLFLLVSHETRRESKTLACSFLCLGLGLTNHHTLLFVGGPIVAWMLYRSIRLEGAGRSVARAAGWGLLGLVPYLYLFLAPADRTTTTWGDTTTASGFLAHLLREQYGTFRLGVMEQGGSLAERLVAWFVSLPGETLWVGAALALVAVARLVTGGGERTDPTRRVLTVSSIALVFYLVVFGALTHISLEDPFWHEVHARFWQQANAIVCLLAGVGFAWLAGRAGPRLAVAALPVAVLLVAAQAAAHYRANDHSGDRAISRLAESLLDGLPRNALLVTKGDLYWNTLRYLQLCEGRRPDVHILDVELHKAPWMTERWNREFPELTLPGSVYRAPAKRVAGSYDLLALFDATVDRVPVFSNALEHGDSSWKERYEYWPVGLMNRIEDKSRPVDLDEWLATTDRIGEAAIEFREPVPPGSWEHVAREQLREIDSRRGARLLAEGVDGRLDDRHLHRTAAILERAASQHEQPVPAVYLNLGISYYLLRGKESSAVARMVDAWRVYLEVAPREAPQRSLVEQVLRDPEHARIALGAR